MVRAWMEQETESLGSWPISGDGMADQIAKKFHADRGEWADGPLNRFETGNRSELPLMDGFRDGLVCNARFLTCSIGHYGSDRHAGAHFAVLPLAFRNAGGAYRAPDNEFAP